MLLTQYIHIETGKEIKYRDGRRKLKPKCD